MSSRCYLVVLYSSRDPGLPTLLWTLAWNKTVQFVYSFFPDWKLINGCALVIKPRRRRVTRVYGIVTFHGTCQTSCGVWSLSSPIRSHNICPAILNCDIDLLILCGRLLILCELGVYLRHRQWGVVMLATNEEWLKREFRGRANGKKAQTIILLSVSFLV